MQGIEIEPQVAKKHAYPWRIAVPHSGGEPIRTRGPPPCSSATEPRCEQASVGTDGNYPRRPAPPLPQKSLGPGNAGLSVLGQPEERRILTIDVKEIDVVIAEHGGWPGAFANKEKHNASK